MGLLKKTSENDYEKLEKSSQKKSTGSRAKRKQYRFSLSKASRSVSKTFTDIISNKELRNRILFTLFIIVIFRGLANIPLPGVDMGVYREFFGTSSTSETSLLFSIFTGGQVDTPSIVGLGIAAFINASIIVQLMTPVIPKLTQLQKEGERGRQAITQYTRYLTGILAIIYSVSFVLLISRRDLNSEDGITESLNPIFLIPRAAGSDWPTITKIIFMSLVLAAGSILVMWLAEMITDKGVGNGSSIIISIGILANVPSLLNNDFSTIDFGGIFSDILAGSFGVLTSENVLSLFLVIVGGILMIVSIVFVSESIRKVPISYARRIRGPEGGQESNLPLKLTLTGVMPMIFASALLSVPQIIVPLLDAGFGDSVAEFTQMLNNSFLLAATDNEVDQLDIVYAITYFLMVLGFAVFYAFVVMKPEDTAENLQKSGGFIPGIRPGKQTEKYVSDVLLKIGFAGGIFLGIIALVPLLARNAIQFSTGINLFILTGIAGTSLLIVVSVVMDTVRQVNSLKATKGYDQYTSK